MRLSMSMPMPILKRSLHSFSRVEMNLSPSSAFSQGINPERGALHIPSLLVISLSGVLWLPPYEIDLSSSPSSRPVFWPSEALGSEALGSKVQGSDALGSEALGGEALGHRSSELRPSIAEALGRGVLGHQSSKESSLSEEGSLAKGTTTAALQDLVRLGSAVRVVEGRAVLGAASVVVLLGSMMLTLQEVDDGNSIIQFGVGIPYNVSRIVQTLIKRYSSRYAVPSHALCFRCCITMTAEMSYTKEPVLSMSSKSSYRGRVWGACEKITLLLRSCRTSRTRTMSAGLMTHSDARRWR